MYLKLIISSILIMYAGNVFSGYPDDGRIGMSVYAENSNQLRAKGASVYSPFSFETVTGKFGISFSEIEADENIENNRKIIHPWYIYVNASLKSRVSPFIEAGFDLGDSILDEISNVQNDDEYVDFYYMIGGAIKLTKEFSVSFYKKWYEFKYYDSVLSQKNEADLSTYGVSVNYLF